MISGDTKSFLKYLRSPIQAEASRMMASESIIGGPRIQNPKPVKDRLTQEQSSSRGIAKNRKWRRKADKGRGNWKPVKMVARSRSTCHYSTLMGAWTKTVNYRASRASRDDSRIPIQDCSLDERGANRSDERREYRGRSLGRKCKIRFAQLAN